VDGAALEEVWAAPFEHALPVRRFAARKGQRHLSGLWWSATTGGHVGFESWLERDQLMLLDFDPAVTGIASQPFWLRWLDETGQPVSHAPDYFARRADGSAVVVDCRPEQRRSPRDAAKFEATAQACARVSWEYRLVGAADEMVTANVRWLAGYRHPRHNQPGVTSVLRQVFGAPAQLMAGAEAAGDPISGAAGAVPPAVAPRTDRGPVGAAGPGHPAVARDGDTVSAGRMAVLRPGDWVVFDGGEHQVTGFAGTSVRLRSADGQEQVVLGTYLMASPDFAVTGGAPLPEVEPFGLLEGLPEPVSARGAGSSGPQVPSFPLRHSSVIVDERWKSMISLLTGLRPPNTPAGSRHSPTPPGSRSSRCSPGAERR
jgi:hypothetical protein